MLALGCTRWLRPYLPSLAAKRRPRPVLCGGRLRHSGASICHQRAAPRLRRGAAQRGCPTQQWHCARLTLLAFPPARHPIACAGGMQYLLSLPGMADSPDMYGRTGLMLAASTDSLALLDTLLASGKVTPTPPTTIASFCQAGENPCLPPRWHRWMSTRWMRTATAPSMSLRTTGVPRRSAGS